MPRSRRKSTSEKVSPTARRGWSDRVGDFLMQCVDGGVAALILGLPFFMGGRHALGQLYLSTVAVFIAVAWCLRQAWAADRRWVYSHAVAIWAAAVALVALQIVHLPPSVLHGLSPRLTELLPLWSGDGPHALGAWETVSLCPASTLDCLVLLASGGLVLIVILQRIRRFEDIERLLRMVGVSTILMAAFGIAQSLTSNGRYFWIYEHPFDEVGLRVGGAFTNENHFAHFLVLGLGALLWLMLTAWRTADGHPLTSRTLASREQRKASHPSRRGRSPFGANFSSHWSADRGAWIVLAWGLALAICIFAAILSLSRGGAGSMALALGVALLLIHRAGLLPTRIAVVSGAMAVSVFAALSIYGCDMVANRMGTLEELRKASDSRVSLWLADMRAVADFPIAGTGLGTHADVYPIYYDDGGLGTEFTHAENGYIQVAMETGAPGLILAVVALGLCLYWSLSAYFATDNARTRLAAAAIAPAFLASAAHSAVDFVWYAPACAMVVVVLGAAACRLHQMTRHAARSKEQPPKRGAWIQVPWPKTAAMIGAGAIVAFAAFALPQRYAAFRAQLAWDHCMLLKEDLARERSPLRREQRLAWMLDELREVERWRPDHPRMRTMTAACARDLFTERQRGAENPFTAADIEDAARSGHYASRDELLAWLRSAIGENADLLVASHAHAMEAARAEPLMGENYLHLAESSFLDAPDDADLKRALLEQAACTRPHMPGVLFAIGRERFQSGDLDAALGCWRIAFHKNRRTAEQILAMTAPVLPVERLLREFEPDITETATIVAFYRLHRDDIAWARSGGDASASDAAQAEWRRLLREFADQARSDAGERPIAEQSSLLLEAARAYRELNDADAEFETLRAAARIDATNFDVRYAVGRCALQHEAFAEAAAHLEWCLMRKPYDKKLQEMHRQAFDNSTGGRPAIASQPTGATSI